MLNKISVLNLEDSLTDAELIREKLSEEGLDCEIRQVKYGEDFITVLQSQRFDLILADYSLDHFSALTIVLEKCPDIPFIFVSGTIGEDIAIEALKSGATDYVLKNNLGRLAPAVSRALKEAKERTAHRQAEEAHRESEDWYLSLFNHSIDAVLLTAPDGSILAANPEACSIFQRTEEELRRLGRAGVVDVTDPRLPAAIEERARTGKFKGELTLVRKDGTKFPGEISSVVFAGKDGLTKTSMVIRDITERKWAQQERELSIEFLRLVNSSTGTRDLIRAATTFFQQQSGCEAVGIRLKEGEDYPYFEARGFPKEFVLSENNLCARDSVGRIVRDSLGKPVIECMCGNVICGRFDPAKSFFTKHGSFWSNNTTELLRRTTEVDRQTRTRNRCNGEGYESVALIPLLLGEERLGLLQLNDRRTGIFSEEVLCVWERLADQLAVALAKFRTEEALRKSEERYRSLFMNMLNGYAYCKMVFEGMKPQDFIYLDVNEAFGKLTGLNNVIGKKVTEVIPGIREADPQLFEIYGRVAMTGSPEQFETYVEALHNWFSISVYSPKKEHFVAVFDVITERKQAEVSLRQSEARFSTVFHNSPISIVISGADDGKFYDVNDSFLNVYGFSREEIIGCTSHDLKLWVHSEEREAMVRMLHKYGRVKNFEAQFRKKSGDIGSLLISAELIKINGEERLLGMFTDITERKRMEEELRTSVRMWDNTFDAMNDGIMISDENGKVVRCNRAMQHCFAKAPDQILGKTHWDIVHHAEAPGSDCAFNRMQNSRRRESMMLRLHMNWFNITVDPIFDADGLLRGSVQILTNVTERKQFEEQLRESESKFKSLAEQSLVGTYIIQDNLFKYVNPRLAEMLEYRPEDIMENVHLTDVFIPEDRPLMKAKVRQLLSSGGAVSQYEVRGLKKSGEILHLEAYGTKGLYQGKPAIIGMALDVTEKKNLERRLLQSQKIEAIGTLAGGVAHDFNNILSAIIGYGHLTLMKMQENEPLRANINQILEASQRATVLTQSLLAFSRKQPVNLAVVDLNALVCQFENLLQRLLREDIDLKTICPVCVFNIMADRGQIEQVLMNLVTNARDAMPDGGRLTIETKLITIEADFVGSHGYGLPGEYALLMVTDTGTGMDEKTKQKVFEPFFTTKEVGKGTGLGLAMVYGIIKKHEGFINIYSEVGRGTTFKIYLPLAGATAAAEEIKDEIAAPALTGTETVLVAEDDRAMRSLSSTILNHFGYTVIEAVDGEDAIFKYIQNKDKIHLVILDGIMPKKNGLQAYQEIHMMNPAVKVIFMSGYSEDVLSAKSILDKGLTYILKPATPSELLKKVREVLNK